MYEFIQNVLLLFSKVGISCIGLLIWEMSYIQWLFRFCLFCAVFVGNLLRTLQEKCYSYLRHLPRSVKGLTEQVWEHGTRVSESRDQTQNVQETQYVGTSRIKSRQCTNVPSISQELRTVFKGLLSLPQIVLTLQ